MKKASSRSTKAQIWYIDLLIGLVIFTVAMVLFFKFATSRYLVKDNEEIFPEVVRLSQILVSEGIPQNWTEENVITPGLFTDGEVSIQKLEMFSNMSSDYYRLKRLLATESDFIVVFEEQNGNNLSFGNFTLGKPNVTIEELESIQKKDIFTVVRYGVYRHDQIAEIVAMKVVVWQ
ncbi:MAG: hypothetical protein HGA85_01770 [Nanoarchaeota archaeon]|nr:hypothetical protein [Nanoarchaeota archaeon]